MALPPTLSVDAGEKNLSKIKGGALMSMTIPPRQSSLFKIQNPTGTKPVGLKETSITDVA